MWNSSDVDTPIRCEFEISAAAVRKFYGMQDVYFNGALDAIVTGCVTEYCFIKEEKKFVGTVTSFDRNESYEVKIFVTGDDFTIESAFCDCADEMCHHIGAIALHSGFKTPVFSYFSTTTAAADDNTTDSNDDKNEIEFVEMPNTEEYIRETDASDAKGKSKTSNGQPETKTKFFTTKDVCRICDKMYADAHQLQIHQTREHTIAPEGPLVKKLKNV